MSTSIKIRKNINMSSKNIVFKGAETGKFAKSHVGKRPKVNMAKPIKLALNSIPATNVVTRDVFQIAKMNVISRILGSISVVAGSQELFKPENLGENTERNFGEKVYHETSGVHEGTKQEMVTCAVAIKEVKGAVSGWEEINGKWKYHDVTKYAKGWNKIDGKWYYFGSDEYMVTGWHSIGGNIYYFKAKKDVEGESGYGYMWEGWRKIDGKWYYFKKEKDVEGESGYGYVWKDWRKIGNKWYYFKSDGEMVASQMIESSNGKRYYLGADGAMVTSQNVNWDKKDYWANEKGECMEYKNSTYGLACTASGEHAGTLTQKQKEANASYIYDYLKNNGWTKEAISGLLGNIEQESQFNPGVWQDWHNTEKLGYGLVQWSPAKGFLEEV